MKSLQKTLQRYIYNNFENELTLIKNKCFEDINIVVIDYIIEDVRYVEPIKYDIDDDRFQPLPHLTYQFTRKEAMIANWYYKFLVEHFKRGFQVVGIDKVKKINDSALKHESYIDDDGL